MSFQEKWRNFWKVKEQQTANAVPNTDLSALETPEERKLRIRGLWICHVVTFVFSLSFSIVFTGVFPYLQQVTFSIFLSIWHKKKILLSKKQYRSF